MGQLQGRFQYYALLCYVVLFYTQLAGRFPVLAPFRLEFIVGSILVFLSLFQIANGRPPFQENRLNLAALLFVLAAFLTIPFALVKTRAWNAFTDFAKFFPIYFMIVATVNSEAKLKGFLYVYLAMITLLFIEPFFLSIQGKGFMYNNHMWRLAGVTHYFGHPNQLGGMTAENLPFFYYLMKYEKSKSLKLVCVFLILASLRVIMLTQSRTGFVGVIAFGVLVWVFSKRKIPALIIMCLACLILWQFAPQESKERFLTLSKVSEVITTDEADFEDERFSSLGSMAGRWELIRRGFIAFTENPLIGIGLNCFISYNGNRWGYWFPPHNVYIQALAEMGIIGFGIFLYVVILIFRNLKHSQEMLKRLRTPDMFLEFTARGLTCYLIIRLVISFFNQDLYANYWWVAGGLSVALLRVVKSRYERLCAECGQQGLGRCSEQ